MIACFCNREPAQTVMKKAVRKGAYLTFLAMEKEEAGQNHLFRLLNIKTTNLFLMDRKCQAWDRQYFRDWQADCILNPQEFRLCAY